MPDIPAPGRMRQENYRELKASLIDTASARPTWAKSSNQTMKKVIKTTLLPRKHEILSSISKEVHSKIETAIENKTRRWVQKMICHY